MFALSSQKTSTVITITTFESNCQHHFKNIVPKSQIPGLIFDPKQKDFDVEIRIESK